MKRIAAIPCYNEGLAIGSVALKASRHVDEVLVVDDGSTDDTVEVAKAAGATVVAHEENKGKGRAVKDDFAIESEMTRLANEHKLRFADVQINCKYGDFKTSTKNPVAHGVGVLNTVIGLIVEKRPLLYIGLPGFVTFVIGVFFGILLLQQYNQTRYFSLAYAMLVSIFMILGAIGLFMGLTLNVIARLRVKDGK